MPVFVEDPAHLSKSRLKSDLVAHNVELPPGKSKKEVYVQLHLKHIDQKNAADFSSDEEDQVQDVAKPEDAEMPDPSGLTDDDLKAALLVHGVKAGPIVASTRALYERKLSKLLQSDGHYQLNGAEKGILYSDSEEEEENGEEDDAESDVALQPLAKWLHRKGSVLYLTITNISFYFSATRRRPIKGAAGRPVQYAYPDTAVSPTTLERREVERRLVPILIQVLVFLIVVCVLYLIYVCLWDTSFSPFVALLDSLNQMSDSEEGLLLQTEVQDTPAPSGQE
uniref:LEM domain containing 1 n=1 Tax=Seriola dumerili TaxID=41447 RepID=A0A3B4VKV2_SERDU